MERHSDISKEELKTCLKCKETKPLSGFHKNGLYRRSVCGPCTKLASQRVANREFVWRYKLDNPCVQCEEADPRLLEFDHIGEKTNNVARMVSGGYSLDRVIAEIDNCQVLCVKCHRIKTWEETWRLIDER